MSSSTILPVERSQARLIPSKPGTRYLYSAATFLLLMLMLTGFQQFYMHGRAFPDRPVTPPIRNLVILHGISMTLWMILALVQSLLISQRKHRLHMKLGMFGAVLAGLVTISGIKVAIEWGRVTPPEVMLWNMPPERFMMIPLMIMVAFAGFVLVGILNRKRKEIHRPCLFFATLIVMPAAIDRIPAIVGLYQANLLGTIFGAFVPIFLIGGVMLVLLRVINKSWDRPFAIAWGVATLLGIVAMQIGRSPLAESLANLLFRIT